MPYLHKSLRGPVSAAPEQPAALETAAVTAGAPACPRLRDTTWALVLGHRQFIRAGVPGCSCGVTFANYPTFVADHAQHLSDEVVREVLTFVLTEIDSGNAHDLRSTIAMIRAMLPTAPALEAVPA